MEQSLDLLVSNACSADLPSAPLYIASLASKPNAFLWFSIIVIQKVHVPVFLFQSILCIQTLALCHLVSVLCNFHHIWHQLGVPSKILMSIHLLVHMPKTRMNGS